MATTDRAGQFGRFGQRIGAWSVIGWLLFSLLLLGMATPLVIFSALWLRFIIFPILDILWP